MVQLSLIPSPSKPGERKVGRPKKVEYSLTIWKSSSESKQATMWVKSSASGCGPLYVIFQFSQDRKAQNALTLHSESCKYLLKDGYEGYNILSSERETELCACWAHVRRSFFHVDRGGSLSMPFLSLIGEMYKHEDEALEEAANSGIEDENYLWVVQDKQRTTYTKDLVDKFF